MPLKAIDFHNFMKPKLYDLDRLRWRPRRSAFLGKPVLVMRDDRASRQGQDFEIGRNRRKKTSIATSSSFWKTTFKYEDEPGKYGDNGFINDCRNYHEGIKKWGKVSDCGRAMVYNVEEYYSIVSVVLDNRPYSNIEIILKVDDGSTDRSGEIW